tara:strand:+ start:2141 stop:2818 length:678 start_codon:yes stop_codon:yes gene_type:complete
MSRYLTTIPSNTGFYNLGTVESYPTGGAGPTAYGPTSYYGSDPLPAEDGDNLHNPIDLGDFSSVFRSFSIKNSHGGLSRKQTTFYKIKLVEPRSVQFTQDQSQFSYEQNTNKNTLLAFYRITEDKRREELPINDDGYVHNEGAIDYTDENTNLSTDDYPITKLPKGEYLFLITNDIRYLETTYAISLNVNVLDWGLVKDNFDLALNFGLITQDYDEMLNFGEVTR